MWSFNCLWCHILVIYHQLLFLRSSIRLIHFYNSLIFSSVNRYTTCYLINNLCLCEILCIFKLSSIVCNACIVIVFILSWFKLSKIWVFLMDWCYFHLDFSALFIYILLFFCFDEHFCIICKSNVSKKALRNMINLRLQKFR